jgi:hypothetical protein
VSDRLFTVEEAQQLLDSKVREMVEQLVAERLRSREMERSWNSVVIAIGSNGGNFRRSEVTELRDRLQKLHESLRETLGELADIGIQVKDVDRGLIDFPALIDGQDALLCWQLGEPQIAYWHTPEAGFAGRRLLP